MRWDASCHWIPKSFDISRVMQGGPRVVGTYTTVFGTDPDVWVEASPITHVQAGQRDPALPVCATRQPRPAVDGRRLRRRVADGSVDVTVVDADGRDEDVNVLIGAAGDSSSYSTAHGAPR